MAENSRPTYYPLFIDLNGKTVLVVGGGRVAERKVSDLLDVGARVILVSPEITERLAGWVKTGQIRYLRQSFSPEHMQDVWLVVAATDDPDVQRKVFEQATDRHIFCNVVDQPEFCSFIVPASVRRGDLCISISTGGNSPALARKIRLDLEKSYGPVYAEYVNLAGKLRKQVIDTVAPGPERQSLLSRIADTRIPEMIEQGRVNEVESWAESIAGQRAVELVRQILSANVFEGSTNA